MSFRRLLAAAVLTVATVPAVASAQNLTFNASQPGAYNNGSYLVGPFAGSLATSMPAQNTALTMFCVDILNTVGFGDAFDVNVTSLANGTDPSNLRHPTMLTQYREAAWIASSFSSAPQSVWGSMQYAMWGLLNPGSAPVDAVSPTIITLANYAASQNFQAFTYASVNYAAFDYSTWSVMTDVRSAGTADDSFKQEFITGDPLPTTATPEPATLALVGGGLLLTAGAARRRRQTA